jgi:hypothetical protein
LQPKSMQQQAVTSVISVFWSKIVWFWLQWVLYIQHCSYLQFVSRVASSVWILGIPLASGMKWSLILAHKLLIAWIRILDWQFFFSLASLECYSISWLSLPVASGNATETQDADSV